MTYRTCSVEGVAIGMRLTASALVLGALVASCDAFHVPSLLTARSGSARSATVRRDLSRAAAQGRARGAAAGLPVARLCPTALAAGQV